MGLDKIKDMYNTSCNWRENKWIDNSYSSFSLAYYFHSYLEREGCNDFCSGFVD